MESKNYYLAIDQGGHSTRALVFDHAGNIVAKAKYKLHVICPSEDMAEQDAEALVNSAQAVLNSVAEQLSDKVQFVKCAGIATQRSNVVCWDVKTGKALSPAISWQDRRAHQWLKQFAPYKAQIHQQTGLLLTAHYGASKLRWCLDHLTEVQQALEAKRLAWGPMVSFLNFRLTRQRLNLVDPANASRTLLWNIHSMEWDEKLLQLFGIPSAPLPRCVPTRHNFGTLLLGDTPVEVDIMTGDQSAAIFAYGLPQPNTTYINIGTGAFLQKPTLKQLIYTPRLLSSIVFKENSNAQYVVECTVNGAGSALTHIKQDLGMDRDYTDEHFDQWMQRACNPPLFLNGIAGLGAPYWIPNFPSQFIGDGEDWEKIVAVAESILFLLKINLEELEQATNNDITSLLVTGGLAASDSLCQRLADIASIKLYRPVESEATARGTAYLLARCPRHWEEKPYGTWFNPKNNLSLMSRYNRWRSELGRCLEQLQSN